MRSIVALSLLVSLCCCAVACSKSDAKPDAGNPGGGAGVYVPAAGTFGGTAGVSGAGTGGTTAGTGGTAGVAGTSADAGVAESCELTPSRLQVTSIDVGRNVVANEDEAALKPIVIAALPKVGSRVAFMSDDGKVHVVTLDETDHVQGMDVSFAAHDFSALYADDAGGTILLTRDAQGGGTLNCGEPTNLCGTPPSPAIPCFDMYLLRFNGPTEKWATKLTSSSATLPPYSTSKTGPDVYMIWWYAHHGRIAFDGARYAAYYGSAISVSQQGCINIHQGDRMQLVDSNGGLAAGGFDWGCSHSGYERVLWDAEASKFVTVCKTDNQNRIAFAPSYTTIRPVDLAYSNLGNLVQAKGGGYWLANSDIRSGQPAMMDGIAEVHLLHFSDAAADHDVVIESTATDNARAPHLAAYGHDHMLAAWETSPQLGDLKENDAARVLHVQARDRMTGDAVGDVVTAAVRGNRYQDFVPFPDGSVAYAAKADSPTKINILRVLPCAAP